MCFMKMIVGLGNPGKKYEMTKHNVGFMTVDQLAKKQQISFKTSPFEAEIADFLVMEKKYFL